MRFIDEVEIFVQAGKGGDGCTSFLRERSRPKGGPDGGDGGRGGNVLFQASDRKKTLLDLHFQKHYRAESGKHGQGKNRHGRKGVDRIIQVPVGSLVRDADNGETLCDLTASGETFVAAHGGRPGHGNAHFTTAMRRAPDFRERGQSGESRKIRCELKLLADVGIVGFPNAGKSTLIAGVSSARPKIADYPFTTLVPQLGLVRVEEDRSFVIADIPGILPGAAEGVGLGLRFLRHIERSSVLLFLVDLADPEQDDPLAAYGFLKEELERFSPALLDKKRVLAINKIDLPLAVQRLQTSEKITSQDSTPVFYISALKGDGIDRLVRHLADSISYMQACEVGHR